MSGLGQSRKVSRPIEPGVSDRMTIFEPQPQQAVNDTETPLRTRAHTHSRTSLLDDVTLKIDKAIISTPADLPTSIGDFDIMRHHKAFCSIYSGASQATSQNAESVVQQPLQLQATRRRSSVPHSAPEPVRVPPQIQAAVVDHKADANSRDDAWAHRDYVLEPVVSQTRSPLIAQRSAAPKAANPEYDAALTYALMDDTQKEALPSEVRAMYQAVLGRDAAKFNLPPDLDPD